MDIFKLIGILILTCIFLAVLGFGLMYVAVNPHVLIVIGIGLGAIIEAIKRCR